MSFQFPFMVGSEEGKGSKKKKKKEEGRRKDHDMERELLRCDGQDFWCRWRFNDCWKINVKLQWFKNKFTVTCSTYKIQYFNWKLPAKNTQKYCQKKILFDITKVSAFLDVLGTEKIKINFFFLIAMDIIAI